MNDEFQKAIERVVDGNQTPASRNAEDAAAQAATAAVVRGLVRPETPPASLREKLRRDADRFAEMDKIVPFPKADESRTIFGDWFPSKAWGWQAVAAVALLFAVWGWRHDLASRPVRPELGRMALMRADDNVKRAMFAPGSDRYSGLRGDVVWSTEGQEGFLRLEGMPANDPSRSQYQLWIVDPERDEFPVDGGVFDIPAGGGEAVVRFHPRLPVGQPTTFVITREQPGGVVKSRNAKPVAVAKL
jgi:Anti-sigma-K factor rskA